MKFEGRTIAGSKLPALVHELRVGRRTLKAGTRQSIKPRAALTNAQRARRTARAARA